MLSIEDFATVDLFCGVGGLTHGLIRKKIEVSAGVDFDASCKYAYEVNNKAKFLYKDITNLTAEELIALYPKGKRKILVGCAPCQPFSIYNHKKAEHAAKTEDGKWNLLYSFGKLIDQTLPDIVSMENVPLLRKFNNGSVFNDFISILRKNNYLVEYQVVNAKDYGVPQRRRRLILLASRLGEIKLCAPTCNNGEYATVRDAIASLPAIEGGEIYKEDRLHYARKLGEKNLQRIRATKEGGSWKDWDDSLKLNCHQKESGISFRSVYGRMSWDDVAPTMTTYCIGLGNGRFGHPSQDRAISLREAALLQSFPADYDFIDPNTKFSSAVIARQIGNAVPVGLGEAIAESIIRHIESINGEQ